MSTITVTDPQKIGDGVHAYFTFTVTTANEDGNPTSVLRRYSEFVWLHDQLAKQCPGYIIPPLPEKVVGILQGSDFINRRRLGLETFLHRVSAHAALRSNEAFHSFLYMGNADFTNLRNGSNLAPKSVADKKEQLTNWWGKAYQKFSENDKVKSLAAKAGKDLPSVKTQEDLEFDALASYVHNLYTQLKALHTKAQNIQKAGRAMANAWTDFAVSISWLAESESTQPEMVDTNIAAVEPIVELRSRQAESQLREFTENLGDYVRWVGAVENAIKVREDRRFAYQADVAAVAKLISQDDPSQSVSAAQKRVLAAKEAFDEVHNRVISEVERFKAEKVSYLKSLFSEFVHLQVRYNAEMTATVNSMLPHLENTGEQRPHTVVEPDPSPSPSASPLNMSSSFLNAIPSTETNNPYGEVAL